MIIETKWELSFSVVISLLALSITLIRWIYDIFRSRENFTVSYQPNNFINSIKFGRQISEIELADNMTATSYRTSSFCSLSFIINNLSKAPLTVNAISFTVDGKTIWCQSDASYFKSLVYSKSLLDNFENDYIYKDGEVSESVIVSSEFPKIIQPKCSEKIRIKFSFPALPDNKISEISIHTSKKVYSSSHREDLTIIQSLFSEEYSKI